MKNNYAITIEFLIKQGHNLCNSIKDYTEAQSYFLVLVENKKHEYKGTGHPLEIKSGDDLESIKESLRIWKIGVNQSK